MKRQKRFLSENCGKKLDLIGEEGELTGRKYCVLEKAASEVAVCIMASGQHPQEPQTSKNIAVLLCFAAL